LLTCPIPVHHASRHAIITSGYLSFKVLADSSIGAILPSCPFIMSILRIPFFIRLKQMSSILQYHFMTLANLNDLYECWVFCKILYAIVQICDLRFKEIRSSKGLVDFKANDTFHVIYQRRYNTNWRDQDKYMEDIPDIAIEFKNGKVILIEAKSAQYTLSNPKPNRHQMRSYMTYMTTLGTRYSTLTYRTTSKLRHIGIFVHLGSGDPARSEEMIYKRDEQKIIWKSMVPGDSLTSAQNLKRVLFS
jgi:hypothetical protein